MGETIQFDEYGAVDLAAALAIASSLYEAPLPRDHVFIGTIPFLGDDL